MAPRPPSLTGAQKRYLRSLAHGLNPVVQIGKSGVGDAVLAQIDEALTRHELLKVKLGKEAPVELGEVGTLCEKRLGAVVAQTIGHVLVLYRRHPERPRIEIPKAGGASSKASRPKPQAQAREARPLPTGWLTETGNDDEDAEDFGDDE